MPVIQNMQPQSMPALQQGGPFPQKPGPQVQPALSEVRLGNPAALGLPGAQGITPEQMAALQSQITPEMAQMAAQWLQDPAVREQMAQMEAAARSGKLTPEMMSQMMQSLPVPPAAGPQPTGMPPNVDPMKLVKTGLLACLLGIPLSYGVDRFISGINRANSPMETVLKAIEKIPGVADLNQHLSARIKALKAAGLPQESRLLRLFGEYPAAEVIENYYKMHLSAQNGALYPQLRQHLSRSPQLLNHLSQARSHEAVMRILEANPAHFLPESIRNAATQAVRSNTGLNRSINQALGKVLPKAALVNPAASVTLQQLDRLLQRETLFKFLDQAAHHPNPKLRLTPDTLEALRKHLSERVFPRMPAAIQHPGDVFHYNLGQLLKNPKVSALRGQLQKVLGLGSDVTLTGFQRALQTKAGYQPLVGYIQNTTRGIVKGVVVTPSTTMTNLARQIEKGHIASKTGINAKLHRILNPFLKRAKAMSTYYVQAVEGDVALQSALKAKGIGPVGRLAGKMGYFFQRIFNGANFKKMGARVAVGSPSSIFGRILVSIFLFGLAIGAYEKAPKESKIARFTDILASGIGGYFGFEAGRNLVNELGILTKNPKVRAFCAKKLFGVLPWSWGAFLGEFVLPAVLASACGFAAQKLANLVFGNPEKIERQVNFEADKNRPLNTDKGLFANIAKGEFPPGITAGVDGFLPDDTVLTPENTQLTLADVLNNPLRNKEDAEVAVGMKELPHLEAKYWNPDEGH